jgi:hypothetical protein
MNGSRRPPPEGQEAFNPAMTAATTAPQKLDTHSRTIAAATSRATAETSQLTSTRNGLRRGRAGLQVGDSPKEVGVVVLVIGHACEASRERDHHTPRRLALGTRHATRDTGRLDAYAHP